MKLCQADLYYWYNDPQNAYTSDVFHGYQKTLNGTFDVVVHEWALNLNIRLGNFSFQIVGIFVMMHYRCFETTLYVPMFCALFQQCANEVFPSNSKVQ